MEDEFTPQLNICTRLKKPFKMVEFHIGELVGLDHRYTIMEKVGDTNKMSYWKAKDCETGEMVAIEAYYPTQLQDIDDSAWDATQLNKIRRETSHLPDGLERVGADRGYDIHIYDFHEKMTKKNIFLMKKLKKVSLEDIFSLKKP